MTWQRQQAGGKHTNVEILIDVWLRDLVFSTRSLYFYRQRLALTFLLLNKALTGLERKTRKEKNTWFCCFLAWGDPWVFVNMILFKPHHNPQNKHSHHPDFTDEETKAQRSLLTCPEVEWLGSGNIGHACRHMCTLSRVWVFYDPMDCSPPGSSVHGTSQARTLEWVAMSSSRGSFLPAPGIKPASPSFAGGFFTTEPWGNTGSWMQICLPHSSRGTSLTTQSCLDLRPLLTHVLGI